jgi:serine protease Do
MKTIAGRFRLKIAAVVLAACAAGFLFGSAYSIGSATGVAAPQQLAKTTSSAPAVPDGISWQDGFASVAARALPAVVNISSSKTVRSPMMPFFDDPFFQQFFGRQFQIPRERRAKSLGSGVVVTADGYILTNNHVVEGAEDITVSLGDKREFKAKVVGTDSRTDIALVKVNASNLPVLAFGDSAKVRVGEFAIAIGNPFGIGQTVTMGIISAIGRGNLGIEDYEDFIQTDAAINPGNSGGALVNARGELIGVNTAILSGQGGGNQGVGFAIPVNMAKQVMDQIMKTGKVTRGYLGAWIQPVTPEIAKAFELKEKGGALLSDLEPGGPAAKAGLQRGDVVLALNGQPVDDSNAFRLKISMTAPGSTVRLKISRNGSEKEIPVVLGEMPAGDERSESGSRRQEETSAALKGLTVNELTPELARRLGLTERIGGVVITDVENGSPADRAGLSRGDVIMEINRKPVSNLREFEQASRGLGKEQVLLLISRNGKTSFIVIEP